MSCRVRRAGQNLRNERAAGERRRRGRVRNQHHVIGVAAAGGLPFRREHADHAEDRVADLNVGSDGIHTRKKILSHRFAEHGHLSIRAHVVRREEVARRRLPVADGLVVGVDAVDRRAPVAGRSDDHRAAGDDRRDRGDVLRLAADLVDVLEAEIRERRGALADAARLRGSGRDHDHVRAEVVDLLADAGARAVADRHHHDDRGHADDDAQHGQRRAHLVLANRLRGQLHQDHGFHAASVCVRSSAALRRFLTGSSRRMRPSRISTIRFA